jgi:hypothetical protein
MIKNNNTLYVRKKISPTLLLTLSAIALLLLASSPMLFINFLVQPVQAANEPMTFRFNTGGFYTGSYHGGTCLSFERHGTNATNSHHDFSTPPTALFWATLTRPQAPYL